MADEAMYDEMDDEASPSTSEEQSVANDTNDTKEKHEDGDETENQLSLVPKHFFKDEPKPGNREMVEVVQVYEGEVSIKCVYGDKDDDKGEESDGDGEGADVSEPEDSMMA